MKQRPKSPRRLWQLLAAALLAFGLHGQAQAQSLTNGLKAYWNFDASNFEDSIGIFDGTANGTDPIAFVDGKGGFGKAIKLNGEDQFVEITGGEPDDLAFEGGSMSVAGWFKVDAFDTSWQALIAKGEGSNWRIHRNAATSGFAHAGGVGEGPAGGPVDDGLWHHFAAISDANAVNFGTALYIDGVQYTKNDTAPSLAANGQRVMIGENPDARNREWEGEIDDVAIWDRVLTESEIATLYNGGAGKPLSAVLVPPADTDKDGLPDEWETTYGLNPNDPSDAAKDCNNNGDSNLVEYQKGMDPCDATKPTILSATGSSTFDTMSLVFSEPLEPTGATNLANYTITPSLAITAVSYKSKVVTLTTAKQTPATTYTVAIKGLRDVSKNEIAAGTTATVKSYVMTKEGLLKFSFYGDLDPAGENTIPGTAVQGLYDDPRYPASPALVLPVYTFNSRHAFPDDTHENYGATIEGYITPKETGSYRFFIYTDDSSELYLSTDDKPANLALIAEETGCCNAFTEPGATHDEMPRTSDPVSLTAGKNYFIRLVYKEGGGGDYGQVAWRKEGDTTPAARLQPIPAEFLSSDTELPGPPAADQPNTLTNGLVAYWSFDGNLLDAIKDFHGTARGSNAIAFVDGKVGFGKSIKLDGGNQFVEITGGNEDELEFPGGSMSIGGWFKVDAFDTDWQALIAKGEGSNYRIARRSATNSIAYAGGIGEGADDVPNINDGQWHHFVAVSDAATNEFGTAIYIDGVRRGVNAAKPVLTANSARLMIGENPEARNREWEGLIDDIAIWNRVVTAAEVAQLYNAGAGTPISSLPGINVPSEGTKVTVSRSGNQLSISWSPTGGTLQVSPALGSTAAWTDVGTANPATVTIGTANSFYRVRQ